MGHETQTNTAAEMRNTCDGCELHGGSTTCVVPESLRSAGVPETYVRIATGMLSGGAEPQYMSQLPIEYGGPLTSPERGNLTSRVKRMLAETPLLSKVLVIQETTSPRNLYHVDDRELRRYCDAAVNNPESLDISVPAESKLTRRLSVGSEEQQLKALTLKGMLTAWVLGRADTSGIIRQLDVTLPEHVTQIFDAARHDAVNSESYADSDVAQLRLERLSAIHPDESSGLIPVDALRQLLDTTNKTREPSDSHQDEKADGTETKGWQDYSNCLGVDPDLFFPERGASTREAKEVCRGCVVREECLEYALANGEKFGIWGGLSERATSYTSSTSSCTTCCSGGSSSR